MDFNEYQEIALESAFFNVDGLVYCTLGLTGESGEFADHVKKMIRDDQGILLDGRKELLIKELGDVLWYLSSLANELDVSLETVAKVNIEKIQDRRKRGVQGGSGDNR